MGQIYTKEKETLIKNSNKEISWLVGLPIRVKMA